MKWFVYSGMDYYPSGHIVEAESPELAREALPADLFRGPFLIFPWESLALGVGWSDHERRLDGLRRGQDGKLRAKSTQR